MNSNEAPIDAEADALRKEIEALERRRDDLAAEREKYFDLYDNAPDMYISVDVATGMIVECNAAALRDLGWARDELIGSPILALTQPDDHDRVFSAINELISGKDLQDIEVLTMRRDGSTIPITLNVTARRDDDGNILYSRGVGRDISDKKRTEASLAAGEAQLRTLTEAFNLVPWTVSRDERPAVEGRKAGSDYEFQDYIPEYIGPQFEKVFGYPTFRWFEPGFWLSMIHPEDLPGALENAAKREAEPVDARDEYRMIAADGRIVPVLVLTTPALLDGRRILSGVIVDLTEIKAAERAQESFMRELDHRVKNTFASVQSILEQTLLATDDVETFLATFHGRIDALATIHNTMARSDWTDVDLRELVESALAPYGEPPRVRTAGESIRISLDAGRILGMVLHELATNAVKYGSLSTPEGNVSVRWRSEDRDGDPALVLHWKESGGPPVSHSGERGYGLRVIEDLVPYELSGKARLAFTENGLCCDIEIPLTGVETDRDSTEDAP